MEIIQEDVTKALGWDELEENQFYALMVTDHYNRGRRNNRDYLNLSKAWIGLERTGSGRIYISKNFSKRKNSYRGDTVIVNVSVDGISNDPVGYLYPVMAVNIDSGEWIFVKVSDNNSIPGVSNTAGDGKYWGCFNISSSDPSHNSTGMEDFAILHVADTEEVNISEIPVGQGGVLDGDEDIAYAVIGSLAALLLHNVWGNKTRKMRLDD